MFCKFCGKELPDASNFCSFCGSALQAPKESPKSSKPFLSYLFAALFLLGGLLPYFLQLGTENVSLIYSAHSTTEIAAISAFSQFLSIPAQLFDFCASLLAIYVALLIIKKQSKITAPLILCAIFQGESVLGTGIAKLLVYSAPEFVLSLFTPNAKILSAGSNLIKTTPALYSYQGEELCRALLAILLVTLSIVLMKNKTLSPVENKNETPILGSILMLFSLSLLPIISGSLSTAISNAFGSYALAAHAAARNAFYTSLGPIILFLFIIIFSFSVLLTQVKRWKLAIPTVGFLVFFGLIAPLFSSSIIRTMTTIDEIIALAEVKLIGLIISGVLTCIAMFFWFSSVSRNKLPTWVQIAWPISLPIVYVLIEIVINIIFPSTQSLSFGIIALTIITTAISLAINKRPKVA